jgi:hypothetical protein
MPDGRISQVRFEALVISSMSLPIRHEAQALVRIHPVCEWFADRFVPIPGSTVWCTRFYQAEPAPVVGTTKCPESLCLTSALPPSGRRVPSPPRTLLLVHRSYRLIRRSQSSSPLLWFIASFEESSQVAASLCCSWDLRDAIPQFFPQMPGPQSRRSHRVHLPVSSSMSSAFPRSFLGRLPVSSANTIFPR